MGVLTAGTSTGVTGAMSTPEVIVLVAVTTAAVAGLARRLRVSAPMLLVLVGVTASVVPFFPRVQLDPDVVLVGILPPLLYASALRTSLVDVRANRRAIGLLSVGAVLVTTLVVAVVVQLLLPVPPAAAFALGAVVAPPDAVAATAVARRVGMPRSLVTVLEGESLANDATALVALRTSIAALAGGVSWWGTAGDFLLSAGGGVGVGLVVAWLLAQVRRRLRDPVLDTTVSLLAPFVAYLPADRIGASGVLAVVVTGVALGNAGPRLQSASARISERTNWRTVQFVLENAVFLLIGLQVSDIVRAAADSGTSTWRILAAVGAAVAATVLVRPAWVFATAILTAHRPLPRWWRAAWPELTVVSWAGMRGVVTLAAVLALPTSTPLRAVLVLAAFVVVAVTLLGQGLTLPILLRRLPLPAPDPGMDALTTAQVLQSAHEAGLERLEATLTDDVPADVVQRLQDRSQRRADAVWERLRPRTDGREPPSRAYERLRLEMLDAENGVLQRLRRTGDVPDDILRRVQVILDVEESLLDRLSDEAEQAADQAGADDGEDDLVPGPQEVCAHLRSAPPSAAPPDVPDEADVAQDAQRAPHECPDCLTEGRSDWVHLRSCLTCGHVGCCDSSPRRHATAHYQASEHPVMRSIQPGEAWRWCFVDRQLG